MDVELYVYEQGSGEPLVLLHGNGEDHTYFEAQIAHFSAGRRVLAVDTRGHGRSPRGTAPFTIEQFADDLYELLDQRGIGRTDLLGFSDGGNIALVFAIRYPERVRQLILNGANFDPGGVKTSVQLPIVLGYHAASLFAAKSGEAKAHAELLGLMVNDPRLKEEDLRRIRCRTLVIAGTRDMIRRKHTEAIHAAIPGSELVFLKGDHFIARKRPEAFNRTVEKFLNGEVPPERTIRGAE